MPATLNAAGGGHDLPQAVGQPLQAGEHAHGRRRDVVGFPLAHQLGHLLPAAEELVDRPAEAVEGRGDARADSVHLHGLDERPAEGQGLEHLLLVAKSAGQCQVRHALAFGGQSGGELRGRRMAVKIGAVPCSAQRPSSVNKSIRARLLHFSVIANSRRPATPVRNAIRWKPNPRSRSHVARKPSSSSNPSRPCRSNSAISPPAKHSCTVGSDGSGTTV